MFSHEMMAGRLASTVFMVCTLFPSTCCPASPQNLSSSTQQMSKPPSTFTVPNPLSPASHWHTMATFACPETTPWPDCDVFVEQWQGTKLAAIFYQKCKTWEGWECAGAQGGRAGASATTSHVHHPDSSFPGSSRMIFWRGFSTQAAFGQVQPHPAYPVFPHLIRRSQNISTWNLCRDVDRWGLFLTVLASNRTAAWEYLMSSDGEKNFAFYFVQQGQSRALRKILHRFAYFFAWVR